MKRSLLLITAVSAMAFAGVAHAATDGSLSSASSVGTLDVNATIPDMVRVSGLDDLTFAVTVADLTDPYTVRMDRTSDFCVYSNVTIDGNYDISVGGAAASASGGYPYALSDGTTELRHAVWVTDDPSNAFTGTYTWPGNTKNYQTTSGGQTRPSTTDCSVIGDNASLKVGIKDADILAVPAGTYTGTLTVTVAVP